jgi:hypothetical protein
VLNLCNSVVNSYVVSLQKSFAMRTSFVLTGLVLLIACRLAKPPAESPLATYFPPGPVADTLRFEIEPDGETAAGPTGDTIPNAVFFRTVPAALLREIDHLADSAQAVVLGRGRFALSDSVTGYWVDIRQHWFQHQSLLLYDLTSQVFTARVTVAEWYGGDGGQVLQGSYLLDYDGDGDRDLVRREIEHSVVPTGDSVLERTHESALLLRWDNGRFVEKPLHDSALVAKQFPLRSPW